MSASRCGNCGRSRTRRETRSRRWDEYRPVAGSTKLVTPDGTFRLTDEQAAALIRGVDPMKIPATRSGRNRSRSRGRAW
jgi:hypothetical protein